MMEKFRKKPVEIEAVQWDGTLDTLNYLISRGMKPGGYHQYKNDITLLHISTLEGSFLALYGDWIIKGVNGEFYPCKPDIFERTYDKVD